MEGKEVEVYKPDWFSEPRFWRQIRPDLLVQLLRPYSAYLRERSVNLPTGTRTSEIDYEALAAVFSAPDDGVPGDLIHALYVIRELATEDAMVELLQAAERRGIRLSRGSGLSPADVVIQVWLKDSELVERIHAESFPPRSRTFSYFQTDRRPAPPGRVPGQSELRALESHLAKWFKEREKGRVCRIRPSTRGDEVWFLVWHGGAIHRAPASKGGRPSSVVFRPGEYDNVVYNATIGEVRIKACSPAETQAYREAFGLHLFGDPEFFPGEEKYTLDPIRNDGPRCLVWTDVPGLKRVRLKVLRWAREDGYPLTVTYQTADLFAALPGPDCRVPEEARLVLAKFDVWLSDSRKKRTVAVRPPNIAGYVRDPDSVPVELWLSRRGFVLDPEARQ
jgi:hypothetical protein